MIYLQLFLEFFMTGLFSIGGGMATIPFLYEMSDKTGWFTHAELANMIAVGESTPGPIGVNMASYVGFLTGQDANGIPGAILGAITATLGLITPSILIIIIIAAILNQFRKSRYVQHAFYGLRPASTGLIAAAGISVTATTLLVQGASGWMHIFNWKGIALACFLWLLTNEVKFTKKLHPILFIAFSAIVGILFKMG